MSGGGRAATAMLAGIAGGLLLGASTTVDWFAADASREIGGVLVPDERGVAGGRLAGELVVVGLAAGVVALGLAVVGPRLRRVAGVVLLGLGVVAGGLVIRGVLADVAGAPTTGVALAVAGALAVAAAGALALRPAARPGLSARYDLDADDADDEWHLASVDPADLADSVGPADSADDRRRTGS